jgi:hypothetical protein
MEVLELSITRNQDDIGEGYDDYDDYDDYESEVQS